MSRAMVSLHSIPYYSLGLNIKHAHVRHDDLAETVEFRKIGFKSLNVWEDLRWAEGSCTFGDFSQYLKGNFSEMENCPLDKELTLASDMIAMHGLDENQKENWMKSKFFSNYFYCYKVSNN